MLFEKPWPMVPGNGWQLGKFIVDLQNQSCREIWREEEKTVRKKPAARRKVVKKPAANVQMAVIGKKPAAKIEVKKQVEKKPATKTQTTKKNMVAKKHPAA